MEYCCKPIFGKIRNAKVTVSVPGSKSITARAFLIAALAEGESVLYGAQSGEDCKTFLNCLKALGIACTAEGEAIKIRGCGGKLPVTEGAINVGSAGTAARFLTSLLAFCRGTFKVNCSEQMAARPVEPLIKTLEALGARFTFFGKQNSFPFFIEGTDIPADIISVDITKSSQFLSGLLVSAVCAGKPVKIKTSGSHGKKYVEMTMKMMREFGAEVEERGGEYTVSGSYRARRYDIEPDASAACYFYAANRILNTEIEVEGFRADGIQGDAEFARRVGSFNGGEIDMSAFSDQALTLAAIAPFFDEPTVIKGVAHIRGQECDRLRAITENLSAMGVRCEEFSDGVKIYPSEPKPARINTFGDHRVAMSFALTGLRAEGIVIADAEVCAKTFENYWQTLEGIISALSK